MTQLIITPDDSGYREDISTFLTYDLENKILNHKHTKLEELNCRHIDGLGRETFRPFGITFDDSFLYIASNDKIGCFEKNSKQYINNVNVPLFINTHQILKSGDILYTTNCANDSIGIYNLKDNQFKFLKIDTNEVVESVPTPWHVYSHDTCHVNSLYEHNNKIYFCLHNRGNRDSRFAFFDKDTLQVQLLADVGKSAHGITIIDNHLYSLSSGTGEIIEINLSTNETYLLKIADPEVTFLRGLDVYQNKLLIGCSNNHKQDRVLYKNNCYVSLLDTNTGQIDRYMEVSDAYVISDLRVI
jgi:hypothetical protein